jgi:fumarylacetoacetase
MSDAALGQHSGFSSANLPYGLLDLDGERRLCTRLDDQIVNLRRLADSGVFDEAHAQLLRQPSLNPFMAVGRPTWREVRRHLTAVLTATDRGDVVDPSLLPLDAGTLLLPFDVADFVDFYSSEQHARNVSDIFGPGAPYLPEQWRHVPIAYDGRAGTVVASGTPIRRPSGQRRPRDVDLPVFGASRRLDLEAEVGFVVGAPSELGSPVGPESLAHHVFGVVLVNDWSARDLQAWESLPLGPFLGKSFATSISPWVVPLDALSAARRPLRTQSPAVLPYLHDPESWCLDLTLEVCLNGTVISRPPFATQYWSPGQQLAHLTANGASLRTGDLFASGTVTGPGRHERGSLLQLSWGGKEPLTLDDGARRSFLEDGDVVSISASAPDGHGGRISLGGSWDASTPLGVDSCVRRRSPASGAGTNRSPRRCRERRARDR